ncbi:hypothetical protein M153_1816000454 [Pseudoloma neurophilia]|uniref:Uncharacterized protein n=1 Tax=Pseudoloma neurophilia TaxID=146866 RepID=A0A0R0LUS1_9MICR|nr:hypothetical protein M153_1816000454 [Pseudoloma neurophilia]
MSYFVSTDFIESFCIKIQKKHVDEHKKSQPMAMDIRTALDLFLDKKLDKNADILYKDTIDMEDLSLDQSASFLRGFTTQKRYHFENFIEEMKYHKITFSMTGRDGKIESRLFKQKFLALEREFDDYSYMKELFKYLYIIAVEEAKFLKTQEEIEEYHQRVGFKKDRENSPLNDVIKCVKIDDKGCNDIFIRRVKPTLSLDDYADMVMANLVKREEAQKRTINSQIELTDMEKYDKELEELKKLDEFKDNKVPGNTYRQA